ncbi:MAG: SpoIIIAH-like family protein [Clostridia bacterium]|nr:SpoIIIAH-like family protein [Clostridia bacterium]
MAFKDKMKSVKDFFWKSGKRNLIIACAVVLIGAAVWINWAFFSKDANDGYTYSGSMGMSGELDNSKNPTSGAEDDNDAQTNSDSYFSTVQVSRQRARDEALEVLQAVVDNTNATDEVKAEAVAEIAKLSLEMQQESDIESMITSKGFEKCIAVINGESASIVVKCSETLTPAELAQINTAVYEVAGIEPVNVTIVGKQ